MGGWWEITQPHVEAAGLKWRGRYPWDWHADVGFATGYTPEERRKLVDVYMEKFKEIFGKYPTAIGSWFIDAYTLGYMYDKYGIVASCNCKDQIGTDGYTQMCIRDRRYALPGRRTPGTGHRHLLVRRIPDPRHVGRPTCRGSGIRRTRR